MTGEWPRWMNERRLRSEMVSLARSQEALILPCARGTVGSAAFEAVTGTRPPWRETCREGERTVAKKKRDADAAADETAAAEAADEGTGEQAEDAAVEMTPATADGDGGGAQPGQIQQRITVDDAGIDAHYSNFCRVSSTPEELILDLGLNTTPFASGDITVPVSQRIIMNHITAKRLLGLLSATLQRHEQAFGVVETDVRRRVRPQG